MTIREIGSYVAGGRITTVDGNAVRRVAFTPTTLYESDPNGTYALDHAWVEYYIPSKRTRTYPVVMVHGGGMHGGMWSTTPDGRPGWLQTMLRMGYEVHVVDNVERGRAGWFPDRFQGKAVTRTLEEAWTLFRFGYASGFSTRMPFPGCRFPVDHLETFGRYFCPRWPEATAVQVSALQDVLRRVGRSIVLCHSQGGAIASEVAARLPEYVERLVAIEPTGFTNDLQSLASTPITIVRGDNLHYDNFWLEMQRRWDVLCSGLRSYGGSVEQLNFGADWPGTTHMLMMDDACEQMALRLFY